MRNFEKHLTDIVAKHLFNDDKLSYTIIVLISYFISRMAVAGCPLSDCDVPGHDLGPDREIFQTTALGNYILFSYLTTYIIDQKVCTLYLCTCGIIRRKLIYLYGGIHMYIRGPTRNFNYFSI